MPAGRAPSVRRPTSRTSTPKIDLPLSCPTFITPALQPAVRPERHGRNEPIPDVSHWTYNLVGMYEAHGLTAAAVVQPPQQLSRRRRSPMTPAMRQQLHAAGPRQCERPAGLVVQLCVQRQFHRLLRLYEHPQEPVQVGHRAGELHRRVGDQPRRSSRWSCGSRNRSCRAESASASAVAGRGLRKRLRPCFRRRRRPSSSRPVIEQPAPPPPPPPPQAANAARGDFEGP